MRDVNTPDPVSYTHLDVYKRQGKSTTFKMMCGLLVPTSGKALVLDMDLKVSSGKARQHLGYMAQKFSLYGNLTVEQNLRFFSGVYGLRGRAQKEKIDRMSEAFGLKSIASHATDELPLGFKPVSYTHLDVYKRQPYNVVRFLAC